MRSLKSDQQSDQQSAQRRCLSKQVEYQAQVARCTACHCNGIPLRCPLQIPPLRSQRRVACSMHPMLRDLPAAPSTSASSLVSSIILGG